MSMRGLGFTMVLALVGLGFVGGMAPRVNAGEPCFGRQPTIVAQGGVTNGTSGSDVILGSEGDDIINGGGGGDYICDWYGANVIHGNSGDDLIIGSGDLYGDSGNDSLTGIAGTTNIYGDSGNDSIEVREESFVQVDAPPLNSIDGGSGNDFILAGYVNTIYGGSNNDDISVYEADLVDCGSGRDQYAVSSANTIVRCEDLGNL